MAQETNADEVVATTVTAPAGPRFDAAVKPGGYLWWYVDGFTPDGAHGLTIIALIGSVFSPYYAWANRKDPLDHVALNVAVYGGAGKRWAMTERRRPALRRDAQRLRIGASGLDWDGARLKITIDERGAPIPLPVRGEVRLYPQAVTSRRFVVDPAGRHRWWPIAPTARIEVDLEEPARRWEGIGYFDSNHGDAPLEADFKRWDWSRSHADGEAGIIYDATLRDGTGALLALACRPDGRIDDVAPPPRVDLPTTGWRVARGTRDAAPDRVAVRRTFEDTPFYARSLLDTTWRGRPALAMHESLDLDRFAAPWVKLLLPFRMPRTRR
ncbi:MAG: carotenoid 1,2-hydratase [Alphaproteobacteria bacterium]